MKSCITAHDFVSEWRVSASKRSENAQKKSRKCAERESRSYLAAAAGVWVQELNRGGCSGPSETEVIRKASKLLSQIEHNVLKSLGTPAVSQLVPAKTSAV